MTDIPYLMMIPYSPSSLSHIKSISHVLLSHNPYDLRSFPFLSYHFPEIPGEFLSAIIASGTAFRRAGLPWSGLRAQCALTCECRSGQVACPRTCPVAIEWDLLRWSRRGGKRGNSRVRTPIEMVNIVGEHNSNKLVDWTWLNYKTIQLRWKKSRSINWMVL